MMRIVSVSARAALGLSGRGGVVAGGCMPGWNDQPRSPEADYRPQPSPLCPQTASACTRALWTRGEVTEPEHDQPLPPRVWMMNEAACTVRLPFASARSRRSPLGRRRASVDGAGRHRRLTLFERVPAP